MGQIKKDPNAWMVTFSDLLMLLLTFFVMLLSTKSIDGRAVRRVLGELSGMGGAVSSVESGTGTGEVIVGEEIIERVSNADMLVKKIDGNFKSLKPLVEVTDDKRGVVITMDSVHLFDSGSVEIRREAFAKLAVMGNLLRLVSNDVIIEGHTDNLPLLGLGFSNWELSSFRAESVMNYLLENFDLNPGKIAMGGYGDSKPLFPNVNAENRSKNRRVEFIIRK